MSNSAMPAFPTNPATHAGVGGVFVFNGLTKREYAAVQILSAMAQNTREGFLPSVADAVNLADRLFTQLSTQPEK